MFKRYLTMPFGYPPETGAGDGGTTDNNVEISGAGASGEVSSGTASDAMIKAFEASSASEESAGPEAAAAAVSAGTETAVGTGITAPAAKGPQAPTGARGEAPQSRIEAAVKNAREAAVTETEAKFAWAKDLNPDSVTTAFNIARSLLNDTPGFAAKIAAELGMKLVPKEEAAKPIPQVGSAEFSFPKGALTSEDGVEAYSGKQVQEILNSAVASLRAEFGGQLKPLTEMRQNLTESEHRAQIREEAREAVTEMMTSFRAKPHFLVDDGKGGKHEHPNILRNLLAIPVQTRARIGAEAAMSRAYTQYLQEDVFPTIGTSAAETVRAENARKAATSTGTSAPGGSAAGKKPVLRDGDVSGLAAHLANLASASNV